VIIEQTAVDLFKPGTGVNASGPVLQSVLERTGRHTGQCIVVHDDMDIAFGDVRLKTGGGDAGHKGVRSIIGAVGSGGFQRIRIGVRPPGELRGARALVLSKFSAADSKALPAILQHAKGTLVEAIRRQRKQTTSCNANLRGH
jgi:UDP-N-acetylmuramoyl-tripeptide--D-alanyl-D-alanine ligase